MTEDTQDTTNPQAEGTVPRAPRVEGDAKSVRRLQQELADEVQMSVELRKTLDKLTDKVAQLESGFERRMAEARARNEAADAKIAEQRARLESLGAGREETMRALSATRSELERMAIERDELRKQLARIDGLQTETIALPEEAEEGQQIHATLPTIEELMASLGAVADATGTAHDVSHLHTKAEQVDDDSQEMISPELVFPEQFGDTPHRDMADEHLGRVSKVLVLLDAEPPRKYPLYKDVMTIGRADSADIQINGDFISRVHARVLATEAGTIIEDVHSKNGIRVNKNTVHRQNLRHGDVIAFGNLRFTFIDTDAVGQS